MGPGIHANVSMSNYHALPAVNSALLRIIVDRCPAAAWAASWLNPRREEDRGNGVMDAGTVAHALLLEGGCDRVAVIDPTQYPAEKTGNIPDGWTNKAIRAARDDAYARGKIPVLLAAFTDIEARVKAAQKFIASLARDEPAIHAAFQPEGGESELTILWDDSGALCRIRPDRITRDRRLIIDYKTGEGSAEPNAWGRSQLVRMGYYVSASLYRRGVKAACGVDPEYIFLVQENTAPYLCSLVGMDPAAFALGGAKINYGLDLWRSCVRANAWPSYPSRVMYPEIPPWETARWQEMEAMGYPYDPAQLFERRTPAPDPF